MEKIELDGENGLCMKILLKGRSGTGKTHFLTRIARDFVGDVLFIDTEEEALLMFKTFEKDLGHIDYFQIDNFDEFLRLVKNQDSYDLICIDTLDDKHTFALEEATDSGEANPKWNKYPNIYAKEKRLMRHIRKPDTHMVCAIDPASGKKDKPKDAQSNVSGRFSTVLKLVDNGAIVRNDVLQGEYRGKKIKNVKEAIDKRLKGKLWGQNES